jgi:hypothetical protein
LVVVAYFSVFESQYADSADRPLGTDIPPNALGFDDFGVRQKAQIRALS